MDFQTATDNFLANLTTPRRGRALSSNSKRVYTIFARQLAEHFGQDDLSTVRNGKVKAYVASLHAKGLSANTINATVNVLRQIVSSVLDDNCDPVYNQKIDAKKINQPIAVSKKQVWASSADIEKAIAADFILAPFLAASGLRISEALALSIGGDGDSYDPQAGAIHIRKTLKTSAAERVVILPEAFKTWLNARLPTEGRPFPELISQAEGVCASYQRAHAKLAKAGLPNAHSFRRFRATWLRTNRCSEDVIQGQLGHAKKTTTDGYSDAGQNLEFVKAEVERCGVGFKFEGTRFAKEAA
jgi:integrase